MIYSCSQILMHSKCIGVNGWLIIVLLYVKLLLAFEAHRSLDQL